MAAGQDGRLDSVQILRALAALMVVLLHVGTFVALQAEARGLPFRFAPAVPLGAGVDLFFVISGFIIVFASERFFGAPGGAAEFFKRRVCRIVPLYWFALGLRLALLWGLARLGGSAGLPGLEAVAASFFFLPYDALGYGPRYPFPILDLGWTLNYEMLFYALFALVMWMPRVAAGLSAATILVCGVLVAWVWPPDSVPLWFWFQPIVLEFALGIGIALLFRHGVRFPLLPRAGLIAAGLAVWLCLDPLWFDPTLGPGQYGWPRLFIDGGGATLILAGAVLGPTAFRGRVLPAASRLGDSSYALYLLHPFVVTGVRLALKPFALSEWMLWPLVLATILAAVAVAHAFHLWVERPVVERLQRIGPGAINRLRPARLGRPGIGGPSR